MNATGSGYDVPYERELPWQANVSVFFDFAFYLWVTFEKKWVIKSP
jgi:hypothetical protein